MLIVLKSFFWNYFIWLHTYIDASNYTFTGHNLVTMVLLTFWKVYIIAQKAVPHVINSRALTGEKPCIDKAIHALLMHGYATFNMPVPGPHNCCRHEMCSARPLNEHNTWKLRSRDIGEKAKQKSARNNAKFSKCFQFLCNNSYWTWVFNTLTFARSRGRCRKPRPMFDPYNIRE